MLAELYARSLGLLTDLYQLTMSYGYWKSGMADRTAIYHLFFRQPPFSGGYAIAAGIPVALEYLQNLRFTAADLQYLSGLNGNDEKPLFSNDFLAYLAGIEMRCDVDAVPEGTVLFAHEPLVRISGPLIQCQLVETGLLAIINFQTLVATKASRICTAASGDAVLEFGLRRAQGIDGGISASRAAYLGGCVATSNVLAGQLFGIPVKGTQAHSWIQSFESEQVAFDQYAHILPNNAILLVDTYDTLAGIKHAIRTGAQLRRKGYQLAGIRLDSGDLVDLSIQARKILDESGFQDTAIVASNDLDEHQIEDMKQRGARINIWGVGTRLATAHDQPALGGVYKLSAIQNESGLWQHKLKLSEEPIKVSNPGKLQVRRYHRDDTAVGDVIYDQLTEPFVPPTAKDLESGQTWRPAAGDLGQDLLSPMLQSGEPTYNEPSLAESRQWVRRGLDSLPADVRRLRKPKRYPVSLEQHLFELKQRHMATACADGDIK